MKENIAETAYEMMVMLGTIIDEMKNGEEDVTIEELEDLYDMATEVNEYFENE